MRTAALLLAMLLPAAASASAPKPPPAAAAAEDSAPVDDRARVDIDYEDGDLRQVLSLVSAAGFHKIVLAPEVTGKVTISVQDKPWDEAFDLIARNARLVYQRRDKTIYVQNAR